MEKTKITEQFKHQQESQAKKDAKSMSKYKSQQQNSDLENGKRTECILQFIYESIYKHRHRTTQIISFTRYGIKNSRTNNEREGGRRSVHSLSPIASNDCSSIN